MSSLVEEEVEAESGDAVLHPLDEASCFLELRGEKVGDWHRSQVVARWHLQSWRVQKVLVLGLQRSWR